MRVVMGEATVRGVKTWREPEETREERRELTAVEQLLWREG